MFSYFFAGYQRLAMYIFAVLSTVQQKSHDMLSVSMESPGWSLGEGLAEKLVAFLFCRGWTLMIMGLS
jgi:hypothetical protein